MLTKDDLQQIGKLIETSEKRISKQIDDVEKRTNLRINDVEKNLKTTIEESLEDTMQTVSDLVHEGYTIQEGRLTRLEEEFGIHTN